MYRACGNLAGACRILVHQHHQRHHRIYGFHSGDIGAIGFLEFSLCFHQCHPLGHPHIYNVYGLRQGATSIFAQVKDKLAGTLLLQVYEGAAHILGTSLGVAVQIQIAHTVFQ